MRSRTRASSPATGGAFVLCLALPAGSAACVLGVVDDDVVVKTSVSAGDEDARPDGETGDGDAGDGDGDAGDGDGDAGDGDGDEG